MHGSAIALNFKYGSIENRRLLMACVDRRQAILGTIAATLTGLTTAAMAQPMMGPGSGRGPGMMGGFGNTESYLASLKAELGINASQEAAWKDYADTVSGIQTQMQGLHQTMFDAMGTASWEERRDMMNRMFQARQQAFDTVHEAANKLMTVLTPAQQTKARRTLPGLAFGPGMMGPRGRGGGPR
jgi:Spy/CpxP family protein refolding chaperone